MPEAEQEVEVVMAVWVVSVVSVAMGKLEHRFGPLVMVVEVVMAAQAVMPVQAAKADKAVTL
jgi:hypothetical protein